jgi:uncharacterized protein YciI
MPRHLRSKHADEPEIAALLAKGSKLPDLKKFVNLGIFTHNIDVLKEGEGILYVARYANKEHVVEDYVPCKFCFQFYVKREVYRHAHNCQLRQTDVSLKTIAADGRLLLDGALMDQTGTTDQLFTKVFHKMRYDKISKVVKQDNYADHKVWNEFVEKAGA